MLKEYTNDRFTDDCSELLHRIDYHYQDYKSDKVYIGTIQKTVAGDYHAICYWGARGANLRPANQGLFSNYESAYRALYAQLSKKVSKGYQTIGVWNQGGKQPLHEAALKIIMDRYPPLTILESPSGKRGTISGYSKYGDAQVAIDGKDVEVPFHQLPQFTVVGTE